jgi:hypothetical protein
MVVSNIKAYCASEWIVVVDIIIMAQSILDFSAPFFFFTKVTLNVVILSYEKTVSHKF